MSFDLELDNRLDNWAYWMISFEKNEVGYPTKSTIADFGLTDSHVRQSKPPFPLNNLQAQEMNFWINVMGRDHPEYKKVIQARYLSKGLRTWELAKILNIAQRTFEQRLQLARTWLEGRLSIEETDY